ncbi:MAG: hypothetical protein RJB38_426 [Pseudomonadota bacterium]|jgi:hypothetical protein
MNEMSERSLWELKRSNVSFVPLNLVEVESAFKDLPRIEAITSQYG